DVVAGGGAGVLNESPEQRNALVTFAHERVAELMGQGERSEGAHRVDEKRVRPVETVDESPAIAGPRPARRLYRPRHLERQLAEVPLAFVERDSSLAHLAKQVAVGGHVVEPVVMHA